MARTGRMSPPAGARSRMPWIAFTTRQGGVSGGGFASLNLGFATPDDAASVSENRPARPGRGPEPTRARSESAPAARQRTVVEAGPARLRGAYLEAGATWPEGDGFVTSETGLPLVARMAPTASRAALLARWRPADAPGSRPCGLARARCGRARGGRRARGPGSPAVVGPGAGPAALLRGGRTSPGQLRGRFGDGSWRAGMPIRGLRAPRR